MNAHIPTQSPAHTHTTNPHKDRVREGERERERERARERNTHTRLHTDRGLGNVYIVEGRGRIPKKTTRKKNLHEDRGLSNFDVAERMKNTDIYQPELTRCLPCQLFKLLQRHTLLRLIPERDGRG
jgi:hypothetical protein